MGAEEPKRAGLQGALGTFQKGRAHLLPRNHLCKLLPPQPVRPGSLCGFQMAQWPMRRLPPPQYSGLPSLPVRVRKFCSNDFRAKFNTQWTPSKTPAPRRKEGLNGKGSQTGSQPHAAEAPLRGCTLTLGEDCSPQATCTPLCRESVFTLTSSNYNGLHWVSRVP